MYEKKNHTTLSILISNYSCSLLVLFLTVLETDQVEAELQVEASSLREELGERKYQVGKLTHDANIRSGKTK